MTRTVYIGSDHRGFSLKAEIIEILKQKKISVNDVGSFEETRCDAADFALKVVEAIKANPDSIGILICGSGQAMAMTANRFSHIRAALCCNATMARLARQHNEANILTIGAHVTGREVALDIVDTFLSTEFLGGRYTPRRDKMSQFGEKS